MNKNYNSRDIYRQLYEEIMTLQRKPGAVLRENALCEEFGVSRTPIRSVLQELRIAGLIEVTPYKSTRVTQLDFDTISQQIYLRVAVETAVVAGFLRDLYPGTDGSAEIPQQCPAPACGPAKPGSRGLLSPGWLPA